MEEWQVCNDAGFIYKRQRRHLPPPSSPVRHHLSEVETHGRRRRSAVLSKIRDRYKQEVALWDHLSDACRFMTENAEREKTRCFLSDVLSSRGEEVWASGRPEALNLVDMLLLQAERREAVIRDLSLMCDFAEALCDTQEEQIKDSLLQLPIWASLPELMAAMCHE